MIIGNKQLKRQSSFSYSKVYQHIKRGSLSEKVFCNHFPPPQTTTHFSPMQVPVSPSPLFIQLLIVLCTFIILLTKTIKRHRLLWKYCELLSVKRKRTVSFHWDFAVVTVFVGQQMREKLSFRSYPSLFRELKTELFWERRHPSHTSPLPFSPLQRKLFAYTCFLLSFLQARFWQMLSGKVTGEGKKVH